MHNVTRSALVPYTPEQMFTLVADVEAYPSFLPWCRAAKVEQERAGQIKASLELAKGPIHKWFTTRNTMYVPHAIEMDLVDGPFRHLKGRWRFNSLCDTGCEVLFELDFELSSALLTRTVGPIFGEIANTMVEAFSKHAATIYGE